MSIQRLPHVHPSSLLAIGIYAAGVAVLRTQIHHDATCHGLRSITLGSALLAFLLGVAILQNSMGVAPGALRFGRPRHLVTSGAFRYSRNPIYCLFFLPIASIALFSPVVALATGVAYLLAMNRLIIRGEEALLAETFGEQYGRYAAATPRWLFRLPRWLSLGDPGTVG